MKREKKNGGTRKLELKKQSLRQLDQQTLDQVAGGWDWYRTCMGTWASGYCG